MSENRTCEVCGKVLSSRIEREEGVHLGCKERADADEETALLVGGG